MLPSSVAIFKGTIAASAQGNILTGGGTPASFGADGGRVQSIVINGVTYTWNGTNIIDPSNSVTDIVGTTLTNIATANGGKFSFNFVTGAWSYTAPASITADITDQFQYTLIDNDGDTASSSVSVTVQDINQAPSGADATIAIGEDTSYALNVANFGFSDSDGDSFKSVIITALPTAGTLTLNGASLLAGATVTLADLNAGLLVFTPAANANGTGYANLKFQVQDNGGTSPAGSVDTDQSANTLTFNVTAINDAPVVIAGGSMSYTENGAAKIINSSLTLSDVDSNNFTGATIKIGTNFVAGDILAFTNQNGISGSYN
ncbi:Ig-like domain-containing protein [Devosia riboflavina]